MLVDDSRLQPSEFCPPYSSSAPAPFLPIRSAWREEYDKAKEDNRRATVGLLADEPRSPIDPENEEVYIAINTLQQAETRTDENVVLCAENAQLDDGIGTNAQEAHKVLYFNTSSFFGICDMEVLNHTTRDWNSSSRRSGNESLETSYSGLVKVTSGSLSLRADDATPTGYITPNR
jgi:hypothetical protein